MKVMFPRTVDTGMLANWIRSAMLPKSSSSPSCAGATIPSPQTDGMRPKESRPTGVSTSPQASFTLTTGRSSWTAPP